MAVRLFHTSDTHLGHQQYPRTDASGLNQREVDIYAAWHQIVDLAVAERPDVFVHAGDLFDGVRPGNRALHQALDGFLKLSRAGIPTVVIAGNHEHPKMRETGSPMRLFEHLDHVHVAYQGRRETVTVETPDGPVRIHAVPQCADNATLAGEVQGAPVQKDGHDVLVVHGGIPSIPAFHHAEFNEQSLDASWFKPFRYVALGHYHGTQQVADNAWYCGAPERVSISEAGQAKGFLDVRLDRTAAPGVRFRELKTRPYADLPPVDADGLDAAAARKAAEQALARAPPGSICRLRLNGLDPALRGTLDLRLLHKAAAHCLHLDLRLDWADHGLATSASHTLGALPDEFAGFLRTQPAPGVDRDRLLAKAKTLLEG